MTQLSPKFRNWLRTLGAPEDPVATDTSSEWSAMSLLKAIYKAASEGTISAAITGRAEGLVAMCQSAAVQCANYLKQTRVARNAAQASAANAATSESNAAASASTASAMADVAAQSLHFAAGTAMYGQRAKQDARAAEAARVAAEAAAASVPTSEQLVLPVQVYS